MAPIAIFAFSGLAIFSIIAAKILESKMKRPLFVLRLISKGDVLVRNIYHKLADLYLELKEKSTILVTKQLPLRARNEFNKLVAFLKDLIEKYVGNVRNSKLLKKSDGISEFYKNISEIEKGNGEINETLEDGFRNLPEDVR